MSLADLLWSLAAALPAGGWVLALAFLLLSARRQPDLPEPPVALPDGVPWPRLSVIVPARNEAPHVGAAMASLLAQDYPALEVLAVDDRSEDATGAVLAALATQHPCLTVLPVKALPDGWLGKNHANHLAAGRASGDLLLFTDADVHFAPGALRAAVAGLQTWGLGHLVVAPRMVAPGYWERAFQSTFGLYFVLRTRLWGLRRPRSTAYVGMGAFNLVRRQAYEAIGGHTRLALEVVDDVKLGLLLRRNGTAQGLAGSRGLVSVRWQAGFRASLGGLLKNVFADLEYRWLPAWGAALALLGAGLGPWFLLGALWVAPAPLQPDAPLPVLGLTLLAGGLPVVIVGAVARRVADGSGLEGLAAPVTHAAFAGVVLTSAAVATWRGGLVWRDTFYPLAQLRKALLRPRAVPCDKAPGW